jgi:hypothetical protein
MGDWNRDIPKLSNKASRLMPLNVRKEIIYYNEMNDEIFDIQMNVGNGGKKCNRTDFFRSTPRTTESDGIYVSEIYTFMRFNSLSIQNMIASWAN